MSSHAKAVGEFTAGNTYRSLKSPHIVLRYPQSREAEARLFLTQAEALVTSYEARFNFRYERPLNVYLTERRFENAFVRPGYTGSAALAIMPYALDLQDFSFEGTDGGPYQVFAHEGIHHIQYEMGRAWIDHLFGPTIVFDNYLIPDWFWEGLAVDFESMGVPYRGRMKPSYHGATLRSVVQARGYLESFDLYHGNYRWRLLGSPEYVVGSGFMDYLHKTYGEKRFLDFVTNTTHLTFRSDFQHAFEKSFPTLFKEFEATLLKSPAPPPATPSFWSERAERIEGLVRFDDGRVAFVASYIDREARLVVLNREGREVSNRLWRRPFAAFLSPDFDLPDEAEALSDGRYAFLATKSSQDGVAYEGVLGTKNIDTGETQLVLKLPDAISAAWASDGSKVWVARRVKHEDRAQLELWVYDTAKGEGTQLQKLDGFTGIFGLRVSPDHKRLVFSAFRDPSWDLYALNLSNPGLSPELLFRSPGQDVRPRWAGDEVLFLSEFEDAFRVYGLRPMAAGDFEICRYDDSRYFVKSFVPNGAEGVVYTDLDGRQVGVWNASRARECRALTAAERTEAPVPQLEVSPQLAAAVPFEENAWKTLIPDTHYVLPRFSNGSVGAKATIAGQSPYRKLSWNLSANFWNEVQNTNASLEVLVREPYPWYLGFGVETQRAFFVWDDGERFREPRYDVGRFSFRYPLYNHGFETSLSYRGPREGPGSTAGYEIWHSFSSTTSTPLSVASRRGLRLNESLSWYPTAFGEAEGLSILRAWQTLYLPWTLFETHSLSLAFNELAVNRPAGGLEAVIGGSSAQFEFDNRIERNRYDFMNYRTIYLRGFSNLAFAGSRAVGASLDYDVSLLRWTQGAMNVMDRLWLNPRYEGLMVNFFFDSAKFVSGEPSPAGNLHASAGATLELSFQISEALPYLSLVGRASRRLTDDRLGEIYLAATLGGLWW